MKVILQTNVDGLGEAGEKVEVKAGFGRNFLLPQGKAILATAENLENWEEMQAELEARAAEERGVAEELKAKIDGVVVVIKAKAGEEGRLFGSVTNMDVEEALNEAIGVEVDRRRIELEENIRELGEYDVNVRVYPGMTAEFKVKIEEED